MESSQSAPSSGEVSLGFESHRFRDPEAAAEALRPRERRFYAHSGRFEYNVTVLALGRLALIDETCVEGVSCCGVPAPRTRSIAFLREAGEAAAVVLGRDFGRESMVMTQDAKEWTVSAPTGSRFSNLVFDPAVLQEHIETNRGTQAALHLPRDQVVIQVLDPAWKRLAAVLEASRIGVRRCGLSPSLPNGARRQLEETLLDALAAVTRSLHRDPRAKAHRAGRKQAFERAIAHAEALPHEVVTVSALCRAAGVSRRTLEYAFNAEIGSGPARYLKLRRLEAAKLELQRSDPIESVTRVALQWGFLDPSQFSQDYRRQFGELPSETLRSRSNTA